MCSKVFIKVKELKAKVQRHKAHPSRLTPYSPEGENKSQGTSLPANAVLP